MLLHEYLYQSATTHPHKSVLIQGGRTLNYKNLNRLSDRLASFLADKGVLRGDRVVVFLDNSIEAVIALFGVLKSGAAFIILNPSMKSPKLNYILRDSGACVIITDTRKIRTVSRAVQGCDQLKRIVWTGPTGGMPDKNGYGIHNDHLDRILEEDGRHVNRPEPIDVDLATIIYTSGSTGNPKGVMSSHRSMIVAATSIIQYLGNTPDDIILSALPLSFDYGLYQVLMATMFGGTVVLEKSFVYPYKVLEKLVKEKATGFPIVPTMVSMMLQMERLAKFDLNSLRYISNTAAALPVSHIRRLRELLPSKTKIFSMYGLTECKRVSYLPPEEIDRRPGSVGIPIPNSEVFVVDESRREVGPDTIGELVVRGSHVMQGYWNLPEETAKYFQRGKYLGDTLLYTGDLFKRDKDGFLYFVGRKDDLIKSKGERISPKEIENCICEIDGVIEAAAIGVPDEIFGQAIKVFVVLKGGSSLSEDAIKHHCLKNLEPFMVPKYVDFIPAFEKTSSGKIDRKKLS